VRCESGVGGKRRRKGASKMGLHEGERPDRYVMNRVVGDAQQGHAPERGARVSHQ
jgi:hypothetical protein